MRHRCARFQQIHSKYTGWADRDEEGASSRINPQHARSLQAAAFTTRRTMARHLEKHLRHCRLCG